MTWADLDPELRQTAEEVCTWKELQAYKLWEEELSYSKIATMLGCSISSVRGRIDRALRKIELALESAA